MNWLKFSHLDWTDDSLGFFYARFDAPKVSKGKGDSTETESLEFMKLYYHHINTPQDQDILIHSDPKNPDFKFMGGTTENDEYLMLNTIRGTSHENLVSYAKFDKSTLTKPIVFKPIIQTWMGNFNYIHNIGSQFYFHSNYQAPRGKIIMIDLASYDPNHPLDHMKIVLPEHPVNVLSGAYTFGGRLIVNYMIDASDRLYIYDYGFPA